tara:strand:- start:54 stop:728 length:675 start_codon:yes stop_codon:yes gene_type:complete
MNSSANFRGADVGTTFIDMYFASATIGSSNSGYDKVRLTVTATHEESALEGVAAALAGAKNPVTIVADDKNSVYVHDKITAVASITLASQTQTRPTESLITTEALEAADSGKIFYLNLLAGFTVTLPSVADAGAGWYADFIVQTVTTSNNYIITEKTSADTNKICSHMSILEIDDTDDGLHNAAHTTITFEGTPAKGDRVRIECDGTFFYATGLGVSDDFVALA